MLLFVYMTPDFLQKRQRFEMWRARLASSSETQCLSKTRNILAARIFSSEHHWKEGSGHCYFMPIACQTSTNHSCISSTLLPKSIHLQEVIQNSLCHWKKKKNELQRLLLFTNLHWQPVRPAGWEMQGLAASSTHHFPVTQLHTQQTQSVVQLCILAREKKKKKDCVCNSCEGLSVCIVLSRTARIKYALKYRIGFIDCISLLMSHPRQGLQCARVHTDTRSLLQKACHQSAGGSKWEPAWFFSLIISPNSMLLKANSEDGPGNWNPSQQGEWTALPLLQVSRDLGRKERTKGEKHHHRGAHYDDCFCYFLSL